jgi:hypothetical protein
MSRGRVRAVRPRGCFVEGSARLEAFNLDSFIRRPPREEGRSKLFVVILDASRHNDGPRQANHQLSNEFDIRKDHNARSLMCPRPAPGPHRSSGGGRPLAGRPDRVVDGAHAMLAGPVGHRPRDRPARRCRSDPRGRRRCEGVLPADAYQSAGSAALTSPPEQNAPADSAPGQRFAMTTLSNPLPRARDEEWRLPRRHGQEESHYRGGSRHDRHHLTGTSWSPQSPTTIWAADISPASTTPERLTRRLIARIQASGIPSPLTQPSDNHSPQALPWHHRLVFAAACTVEAIHSRYSRDPFSRTHASAGASATGLSWETRTHIGSDEHTRAPAAAIIISRRKPR